MVSTDMKTIENAALYRRIQLSVLADGELTGEEFAEAMAWFEGDSPDAEQTRATWRRLHVVGDVLRSGELAFCQGDMVFLTRLQSTLKLEARLAPAAIPVMAGLNRVVDASPHVQYAPIESANEPVFRWKWVAGLASAAAVMAVSWNLVGGVVANSGAQLAQGTDPSAGMVSQTSTATSTSAKVIAAVSNDADGAVMLRNPQLDAMIAAHSQLGGGSALQMPSGFLRNATFDAVPNRSVNSASR